MTSPSAPVHPLIHLSASLGFDDGVQVVTAMRRLYEDLDQAVRAAATGFDAPCHAGCDACCHESVFLSAPEFLAVMEHLLRTSDTPTLRRLVREMGALATQFEDELDLLETITPGPERNEVAARIKFRCPLLDDAGCCSVYAARELNGRTFGACHDEQTGDAYGCHLTHERLKVLGQPPPTSLFGAREARLRLVAAVPHTKVVHVYPWWFREHADAIARELASRR